RRVRPGGPGWRSVAVRLGFGPEPMDGGALNWTNWIAGVLCVYATLFGVGKLLFGAWLQATLLLGAAVAAFAWIGVRLRALPEGR
ncbi:MAG: hypothetical protein ACODAA_10075, partial [Gemmatimonadota bacterium]